MCQNKWMPLKYSRFRVLIYQVLLPGAPLFLAHVADGYDVTIHEVRLVFLRCMSLVFTALGHLVVLILCMEKNKNMHHIVFVTSCASCTRSRRENIDLMHSCTVKKVWKSSTWHSATMLTWNQVPEFMQPELEVTLFWSSGCGIKFCKTWGFPEKDTMLCTCPLQNDGNGPVSISESILGPNFWVDIIPDLRSRQDWILSCTVKTTNTSDGSPKDLRELRLGDVFWCQQKDAKHVVEVTFVNIGSIFCCKYKSRWKMVENDRTLGLLGVVFHGLFVTVTPLNGSSSVATSFRQWCTRVDVQLSESLSKWSKFQLQNSFQDICWESRQIEVDWKSFQVLDNSAVIQVDRSSLLRWNNKWATWEAELSPVLRAWSVKHGLQSAYRKKERLLIQGFWVPKMMLDGIGIEW